MFLPRTCLLVRFIFQMRLKHNEMHGHIKSSFSDKMQLTRSKTTICQLKDNMQGNQYLAFVGAKQNDIILTIVARKPVFWIEIKINMPYQLKILLRRNLFYLEI